LLYFSINSTSRPPKEAIYPKTALRHTHLGLLNLLG